jgi:hypothetical protein
MAGSIQGLFTAVGSPGSTAELGLKLAPGQVLRATVVRQLGDGLFALQTRVGLFPVASAERFAVGQRLTLEAGPADERGRPTLRIITSQEPTGAVTPTLDPAGAEEVARPTGGTSGANPAPRASADPDVDGPGGPWRSSGPIAILLEGKPAVAARVRTLLADLAAPAAPAGTILTDAIRLAETRPGAGGESLVPSVPASIVRGESAAVGKTAPTVAETGESTPSGSASAMELARSILSETDLADPVRLSDRLIDVVRSTAGSMERRFALLALQPPSTSNASAVNDVTSDASSTRNAPTEAGSRGGRSADPIGSPGPSPEPRLSSGSFAVGSPEFRPAAAPDGVDERSRSTANDRAEDGVRRAEPPLRSGELRETLHRAVSPAGDMGVTPTAGARSEIAGLLNRLTAAQIANIDARGLPFTATLPTDPATGVLDVRLKLVGPPGAGRAAPEPRVALLYLSLSRLGDLLAGITPGAGRSLTIQLSGDRAEGVRLLEENLAELKANLAEAGHANVLLSVRLVNPTTSPATTSRPLLEEFDAAGHRDDLCPRLDRRV